MSCYFKDKVAVVTGAASGFGLGISQRLLELGAKKVWMSDFNGFVLGREADKLKTAYPGRVEAVVANAMKREDVEGLIERAAKESGTLDFLFNNAGRPMTKPSEDITADEFEDLVKLNYLGVVYGTLAALKIMIKQGHGHIINTASCGGLIPTPFQTAYASTKAAVITMTRCMAYEYAGMGIHFTQFSPTNVATNIFGAQEAERLRKEGRSEEEIDASLAIHKALKAPAGAMPLDKALDEVFEGIEQQKTDIIIGQDGINAYKQFCEDRPAFDKMALELGAKRKVFYEALKRGEDIPFPG